MNLLVSTLLVGLLALVRSVRIEEKKTKKNNTRTQKLTRRVNQAARKVMPPFSWTSDVFGFSFIFVCVFLLFGGWWPETVFHRRLMRCMMMCAYQQSSVIGLPTTTLLFRLVYCACAALSFIGYLRSFVDCNVVL